MEPGEHDGFQVLKGSPARLVRRLKKRKGKHIFLMGGGGLGRAFLEADLVDRSRRVHFVSPARRITGIS